MNTKVLLALAIVAALVVLVTPYYTEEDADEFEKRGAWDDSDVDDLEYMLQKRGRGRQYIRKLQFFFWYTLTIDCFKCYFWNYGTGDPLSVLFSRGGAEGK